VEGAGGSSVANQAVRMDYLSTPESGLTPLRNWWLNSLVTDQDGFFELSLVQPGVYSLVASNPELGADILDVVSVEAANPFLALDYEFGRKSAPLTPPAFKILPGERFAPSKEVFGGGH
jgi:hypothetical protein